MTRTDLERVRAVSEKYKNEIALSVDKMMAEIDSIWFKNVSSEPKEEKIDYSKPPF